MIAVIFEVEIKDGKQAAYLDTAATLRPLLDDIDGFISVERFQSLSNPDKLLSLSIFRDENAVTEWRNVSKHTQAQDQGRAEIFKNYRIRVAQVLRDYSLDDRDQAPKRG